MGLNKIDKKNEDTPEKRKAILDQCKSKQEAMNKYVHRWVQTKILEGKEWAKIAVFLKEKFEEIPPITLDSPDSE